MTDHLKDSMPYLEKYKVVQISPAQEDRNQEDCQIFDNFILFKWS